jgi:hypothetical protein
MGCGSSSTASNVATPTDAPPTLEVKQTSDNDKKTSPAIQSPEEVKNDEHKSQSKEEVEDEDVPLPLENVNFKKLLKQDTFGALAGAEDKKQEKKVLPQHKPEVIVEVSNISNIFNFIFLI